MQVEHWETVRSIYLDGIETGQATFETDAPTWEQWHNAHLPSPRLVADSADGILGWAASKHRIDAICLRRRSGSQCLCG